MKLTPNCCPQPRPKGSTNFSYIKVSYLHVNLGAAFHRFLRCSDSGTALQGKEAKNCHAKDDDHATIDPMVHCFMPTVAIRDRICKPPVMVLDAFEFPGKLHLCSYQACTVETTEVVASDRKSFSKVGKATLLRPCSLLNVLPGTHWLPACRQWKVYPTQGGPRNPA